MWVGQTYYFTWLDGQFGKLEKDAKGAPGALWMVHSGGFYTVEKQKSLRVGPEQVHWFRWEAAMTGLSGIVLMFLVYYFSGGLLTRTWQTFRRAGYRHRNRCSGSWLADLRSGAAVVSGEVGNRVCDIFACHDCRVRLGIGACFQWARRLHPRRGDVRDDHDAERVGADSSRAAQDDRRSRDRRHVRPALGAQAKLRSKHNTFMAVPVVFIMLSHHFPVATYGNTYSWQILVALVLIGWGAAKVIRQA